MDDSICDHRKEVFCHSMAEFLRLVKSAKVDGWRVVLIDRQSGYVRGVLVRD